MQELRVCFASSSSSVATRRLEYSSAKRFHTHISRGAQVCLMLLLLCSPCLHCWQQTRPNHVSPFLRPGVGAESVCALVEAELSVFEDLEVIDRAHIAKMLAEHEFDVRGVLSVNDSLKAGRLLGCDLFVVADHVKAGARRIGHTADHTYGQLFKELWMGGV
jgi:hypothetical protein